MRKLITAALSLLAAVAAQAVPVTFQVDVAHQINQGTFIPGTSALSARGSFNGWANDFALAPISEGSTTYSGTRDIAGAAGSTVEYKFVINNNGSDNWESISNRRFALPSAAQTLPLAYFNNEWSGEPVAVTFQVNMGTQTAAGNFDAAAGDIVEVRGAFNNWSGGTILSPSAENTAIYTTTVPIPNAPGSRVEYKFVVVKAPNGTVNWENGDNRAFTQTAEPQTLPVVYFNNVSGVPIRGAITFQVDMNPQIAAGNFDPITHQVWIRGSRFGWGDPPNEGFQLAEDTSRPGIYTGTYRSEGIITGEVIEYKATLWKPGVTWENGGNKTVSLEGNEPLDEQGYRHLVIDPWYFDGVGPGELLTADTLVTFRVNMRGAIGTDGTIFDPGTHSVMVNGAFLPGGWRPWGSLGFEQEAWDDGVSAGDETANDLIYSWQTTLPRGSAARLVYKYSINGADNEAPAGTDHVRYVRETDGSNVLPLDAFGVMTQETLEPENLGEIVILLQAENRVVLTWAGAAGVRLQKRPSVASGEWETITETDGQSRHEVPATESTSFFRLVRE